MSTSQKQRVPVTLNDISIHPNLISKLKSANLYSFKKILHFSQSELKRALKISEGETKIILDAISHAVLSYEARIAYNLRHDTSSLKKEQLSFDFLQPNKKFEGIYTGTITEICGESGSGKTQLCLHISISAQLPQSMGGLSCKVLYIHSEGEFPIKRFMELAESFKASHKVVRELNLTDNLILKNVLNLKGAMHVLQQGIPELEQKGVCPRLLIIDSVAALIRGEYDSLNLRTLMIQQFATEIWKLANIKGMTVVCVNQVSGHVQCNPSSAVSIRSDIPSLGLLWSNILTTRLKISRKTSHEGIVLRLFEVVFSSYHPCVAINFIVTQQGIKVVK